MTATLTLGAWTLATLVPLHAATALKRQFAERDAILYRMWARAGGRTS